MAKRHSKEEATRARNRPPQKLSNVLTDLMAQRGYAQLAASEECNDAWRKVIGSMEKFTRATEVKRGVLQIIVSNSVVMQELTFRRPELVAAMSKALPNHKIKDLRFRVGSI